MSCVDSRAGFSKEGFSILSRKVADNDGVQIPCTLVFDEMSISKKKDFNGTTIFGYVDTGEELIEQPKVLAQHALVFLLCPLGKSWKVPIAYFLVASLSSEQLKRLVMEGLKRCAAVGMNVHNLVFDGASTNFSMCASLGCNFTSVPPITSFPHPTSNHMVNVMPDLVHMLKVVRNCFGQWDYLVDCDGGKINFQHVRNLYEIQKAGTL